MHVACAASTLGQTHDSRDVTRFVEGGTGSRGILRLTAGRFRPVPRIRPLVLLIAIVVATFAAPAHAGAAGGHPWPTRIASARHFAQSRQGVVGFAVTNRAGKVLGGWHVDRPFLSASVVKAMFLVCYLQRGDVRSRALQRWERALLAPMVRASSDSATNQLYARVPQSCLYRIARATGMRGFTTNSIWGTTRITPAGTVRFFYSIDRRVPPRHRAYARELLRSVVPSQRWGLARAVPRGWRIFFKGGFVGPPGGRVENQGAMYERGRRRFALSVLSNANPSHDYGAETERGIAARLLRGYR